MGQSRSGVCSCNSECLADNCLHKTKKQNLLSSSKAFTLSCRTFRSMLSFVNFLCFPSISTCLFVKSSSAMSRAFAVCRCMRVCVFSYLQRFVIPAVCFGTPDSKVLEQILMGNHYRAFQLQNCARAHFYGNARPLVGPYWKRMRLGHVILYIGLVKGSINLYYLNETEDSN